MLRWLLCWLNMHRHDDWVYTYENSFFISPQRCCKHCHRIELRRMTVTWKVVKP